MSEARITVGEYDDDGCWHPRWMDEDGNWHEGWGWYDEDGGWRVELGHYDPDGAWIPRPVEDAKPTPFADEISEAEEVDDTAPLPYVGRFDRQPIPFIGSSALAHTAFLVFAMMMPDAAGALDLDGYDAQDRFVQAALTEMQQDEPPAIPGWAQDSEPQPETAKHAGEEGEAGDPDETATNKRLAMAGPPENEDIQIAEARNQEIAMSAGVATQLSSLWATSDRTVGSDAVHALGHLDGADPGRSRGVLGMGVSDAGRGGGGHHGDSLGRHHVDTTGLSGVDRGCRGTRCGKGSGTGIHGWDDKKTKLPPRVVPGTPKLVGALDREIIQRVVRNHRRELRYCYEQQLQKKPGLEGQLLVKFTVGATGDVVAAVTEPGSSTLKNNAVSSCVTQKIRRWVFPRSPGNEGIVIVRYPFRFSAGG